MWLSPLRFSPGLFSSHFKSVSCSSYLRRYTFLEGMYKYFVDKFQFVQVGKHTYLPVQRHELYSKLSNFYKLLQRQSSS